MTAAQRKGTRRVNLLTFPSRFSRNVYNRRNLRFDCMNTILPFSSDGEPNPRRRPRVVGPAALEIG